MGVRQKSQAASFRHAENPWCSCPKTLSLMRIPDPLREELAFAINRLLNSWRVWCGDDELRALHVGYDCGNAEIVVDLLTNNEPYLDEQNLDGFSSSRPEMGDVWPTADWRLSRINYPGIGDWPDANRTLEWIAEKAESASDKEFMELDQDLNNLLISIVTSNDILGLLCKFRRISLPLAIRVMHFHGDEPFDYQLTKLIDT